MMEKIAQYTNHPIVVIFVAILAGGGTAVGYRHSSLSDPYPGKRGETLEREVSELIRVVEHVKTEHNHIFKILEDKPPQDLLQDVAELKADVRLLTNAVIRFETLLRGLNTRGHWSPNDIISPGIHKHTE